jgi:hypothetical protein
MSLPSLIAVVCVAGSLASASWTMYALTRWPRVEATVLRYHRSRDNEGVAYMPVYRFSTSEGDTVTAISFSGSWRRPWQRGARVTVRYCPTNPRITEIDCFANNWWITLVLLGLATIFYAINWLGDAMGAR